MDLSDLGLAIIPPSLAILVEALNPVNEHVIRQSTSVDLQANEDFSQSQFYLDIVDRVTTLSTAAVEIAGLAPTLVAAVTSGFVVIHNLSSPFWPTILYVLILVGVALFLVWLLSGTTFYSAAVVPIKIKLPRFSLTELPDGAVGRTRQEIVARSIYAINGLLILASIIVCLVSNWASFVSHVLRR